MAVMSRQRWKSSGTVELGMTHRTELDDRTVSAVTLQFHYTTDITVLALHTAICRAFDTYSHQA